MPRTVPATNKRNAILPLSRRVKGWVTATRAARYTAAMRHLFKTPKGTYPWAPSYGTRLDQYRTQIIDDDDATLLVGELISVVKAWVPDVSILTLDLEKHPDEENININIVWAIPDAGDAFTSALSQPRFAFGPVRETITV